MNIASVEGLEGTAGGSAYNASKGGVVILTKNMAIDYGRAGIRANAICPGFIETPMLEGVFGDGGHRRRARRHHRASTSSAGSAGPTRSRPSPLFLVSSDASFVTGVALAVDGGYTAGRDHGVTALMGLD